MLGTNGESNVKPKAGTMEYGELINYEPQKIILRDLETIGWSCRGRCNPLIKPFLCSLFPSQVCNTAGQGLSTLQCKLLSTAAFPSL